MSTPVTASVSDTTSQTVSSSQPQQRPLFDHSAPGLAPEPAPLPLPAGPPQAVEAALNKVPSAAEAQVAARQLAVSIANSSESSFDTGDQGGEQSASPQQSLHLPPQPLALSPPTAQPRTAPAKQPAAMSQLLHSVPSSEPAKFARMAETGAPAATVITSLPSMASSEREPHTFALLPPARVGKGPRTFLPTVQGKAIGSSHIAGHIARAFPVQYGM